MECFTYWFVRVKEVDSSITFGEQVEDHSFKLPENATRKDAKEYCVSRYGPLPFQKPRNGKSGDRYFYLMESNQYWFDFFHKEYDRVCKNCGKHFIQVGSGSFSRRWDVRGESICSYECNHAYEQKLKDEYNTIDNPEYWVSDCEHPLASKEGKRRVGYIYRITNKNNLDSYVGKTIKPPLFRWWQHLAVDKKFLQEDLTQLLFEVLEIVYVDARKHDNKDDAILSDREKHYINLYDTVNHGFNKIQ